MTTEEKKELFAKIDSLYNEGDSMQNVYDYGTMIIFIRKLKMHISDMWARDAEEIGPGKYKKDGCLIFDASRD